MATKYIHISCYPHVFPERHYLIVLLSGIPVL